MAETISIIIPVYNVERYIGECIESIIHQTYKELEIILVNDGSTDESGRICEDYKKIDRRIKVIHKSNGGLSDARNAGLDVANGNYIGFVDADDFIEKDMYDKLYAACKKNHTEISICTYDNVDQDGFALSERTSKDKLNKKKQNAGVLNSDIYIKYILTNDKKIRTNWSVCIRLYRRELIGETRFDKGKCFEDILFSTIVVTKTKRVSFVASNLYHYRRRRFSITNTTKDIFFDKRIVTDLINQQKKTVQYLAQVEEKTLEDIAKSVFYQEIYYYSLKNNLDEYDIEFESLLIKWKLLPGNIIKMKIPVVKKVKIFIIMWMPIIAEGYYKILIKKRACRQ